MAEVERISPEKARQRVQDGQALLVCGYEDERCASMRLEGAITIQELREELPSLPKSQEIITYCA